MTISQSSTRRLDTLEAPLHVVTCIFNPYRYRMRWELYHKFAAMVEAAGGILWTVEVALGDRAYAVTEASNPRHLQLRTPHILWHKERSLNLLVRAKLPEDWKYMAWVDADVTFARNDWLNETRHLLQIHDLVQMFRIAQDLDYDFNPFKSHLSFAASHLEGVCTTGKNTGAGKYAEVAIKEFGSDIQAWHPGFAWAITRQAYDHLGGLLDVGIAGAGDNHMAKSMLGYGAHSVHPKVSPGYRNTILKWQKRALELNQNMGYIKGLLLHHWHGPKANRMYWDRWKILTETQFDPSTDLRTDSTGLYAIERGEGRQAKLVHLLRQYFAQRSEDALS